MYAAENTEKQVFVVESPDKQLSPYTGLSRKHWKEAAIYLLNGAFGYVPDLEAPLCLPKQEGKSYPRVVEQEPTAKLEALCRTMFLAGPLLKENPELRINNIPLGDYYRRQVTLLLDSQSPIYVPLKEKSRANGGQKLVELGGLALSFMLAPEVFWEPLSQEVKDSLAVMMLSYGEGPTIDMNWRFFNINIMSFFKSRGYRTDDAYLEDLLRKVLADYRGDGWYNDSPYYDYYSMWAFQMYGSLWAEYFGKDHYPLYAERFLSHLKDLPACYPLMFAHDGRMIMWGRSITYRMGAAIPLALTGLLNDAAINYGWMRRIASSTILQFLQHPDFLDNGIPSLGFYGAFEPAVQTYSCRGSAYWMGKLFLALYLPEDNLFWKAVENNGAWTGYDSKRVYNKYTEGANILITNYPSIGASEIRSTASSREIGVYQGTENYNRLSYNSAFLWQADGRNGEVAMNYVVKNKEDQWEALRIFNFAGYKGGFYYREAQLASNPNVKFHLAEMPLANGILRVDKVKTPYKVDIRFGHYALPQKAVTIKKEIKGDKVYTIDNGLYQLSMINYAGWSRSEFVEAEGLHPESTYSTVINSVDCCDGERIYITLLLWEEAGRKVPEVELNPVKKIECSEDLSIIKIVMKDDSVKEVVFI